jgi:aminoglycoside phosphotransferase (APT) family kinase protein
MDLVAVGDEQMVLRRYGPWYGPGADPAGDEWSYLERLLGARIPVPAPRWIDRMGVFAEEALLITYLDGEPLFDPADPGDWADQLATTLASIHLVDPTGLPAPTEALDLDGPMPERFASFPLGSELWDACLETRPRSSGAVFLHSDFWPGNTLWLEERLVATIDWEHPAIGDPMLDVAYTEYDLRYLYDDAIAQRFVSSYLASSDRSTDHLRHWELQALARPVGDLESWVRAWQGFGLAITFETARHRHLDLVRAALA